MALCPVCFRSGLVCGATLEQLGIGSECMFDIRVAWHLVACMALCLFGFGFRSNVWYGHWVTWDLFGMHVWHSELSWVYGFVLGLGYV